MGFARENPPYPVRRERVGEKVALALYAAYPQAISIPTFPRRTGEGIRLL
jgi:hypothetical protein